MKRDGSGPERRMHQRERDVEFCLSTEVQPTIVARAIDANMECAAFPATEGEALGRAKRGRFRLNGTVLEFQDGQVAPAPGPPDRVLFRYRVTERRPVDEKLYASFLEFEMAAVWSRFNDLRERDRDTAGLFTKLFAPLIAYAAAPFSVTALQGAPFLRVWGVGGIWLAVTAWFVADRGFRAYGRHLKERALCLGQIAVLRRVMMNGHVPYERTTLLPVGQLRRKGPRTGFVERISPSQVAYAAYFFKFISAFPLLLCWLFLAFILSPGGIIGAGNSEPLSLYLRISLGSAALAFCWLWASARRCLDIQLHAFSARRICVSRPWPLFPMDEVQQEQPEALPLRLFPGISAVLAAANLVRLVYLLANAAPGNAGDYWMVPDVVLASVTLSWFVASFAILEKRLRELLDVGKKLDPVGGVA